MSSVLVAAYVSHVFDKVQKLKFVQEWVWMLYGLLGDCSFKSDPIGCKEDTRNLYQSWSLLACSPFRMFCPSADPSLVPVERFTGCLLAHVPARISTVTVVVCINAEEG